MNVELHHISKHFGSVQANDDISLTFNSGRIVGVLGENGAGKSTLMKILAGYQPADSGEIHLDGKLAAYHSPQGAIAHGVGMLQQDPLDVAPFTVIENFIYGHQGGLGVSRKAAVKSLGEMCVRVGFTLDPEMPVSNLSIGQRQQLEIVRLLTLGVKTLILDEPTTGISAEQKQILFDALRALAKNDGLSILLVSHKLEDVIALCDEVVVLREGKLVGTAQMPVTTDELVRLMFGQALAPQFAPPCEINGTAASLENVTLRGKRVSVENFSLDIGCGEVIGLAGLDGSGQELILRALAGLVKPVRGKVKITKDNVSHDLTGKTYRDFMDAGVAFGAAGRLEEGLIAGLSLTEHIALTAKDTGEMFVKWRAAKTITDDQLKRYDVRGKSADSVETLSGGNQQRMLMALMPGAPILMALEQPTRGLDVDSARWIWTQLLARRDNGTAIVFTSPDLDEIVNYSDRIFVVYAGHTVEIQNAKQTTIDELGRFIGGEFEKK
jgi:simple sugar transport system ATP-binding protein